jgi:hypothetical protein
MLGRNLRNSQAYLEALEMLTRSRLLLGLLITCAGTLFPLSAQAQDTIAAEAYSQINLVQQTLASGLISSTQASDLVNRYNDILARDQQWSIQDGGSLNLPDRLSLEGKLKGTNKRLQNYIKDNGYTSTNGSIFSGLLGSAANHYAYNTYNPYNQYNPYAASNSTRSSLPWTGSLANPYGYGYSNGIAPLASTLVNKYLNGTSLLPANLTGGNFCSSNQLGLPGSGLVQGLLNRWTGY